MRGAGWETLGDARIGRVVDVRARLAVRGIWRRARRIIVVDGAVVLYSAVFWRDKLVGSLSDDILKEQCLVVE